MKDHQLRAPQDSRLVAPTGYRQLSAVTLLALLHNAISEDQRALWASIPRLDPGLVLAVLLPRKGATAVHLAGCAVGCRRIQGQLRHCAEMVSRVTLKALIQA
jgi:hypothetical protein